jgi:parallel beta-helix repeat protein
VIYDTDVDFDDTVALAALAEQHIKGRIDLRAVTITNNGAGLPGKGYQHVRCLLDSLGLNHIPVADATYDLPHAFSDQLRFAIDFLLDASIPDCAAGHTLPTRSASELLADEIENSDGRLTLIPTGPLTNVARAIEKLNEGNSWRAAALIDRAYIEGGAFDGSAGLEGVPGFDGTQTFNIWGDPAAAQSVFRALRPGALYLISHDATDFVPVRLNYVAQIAADAQTPAARYVATLMNHPLLVGAVQAGLAVFWWDPLAALSATNNHLVQYRWKRVDVIQDGISSGRTVESPTGTWIRVGISADTALFESTLLNVLNGADSDRQSQEPQHPFASNNIIVVSTTIQAAIDAAQAGDTILVPPGVYRENVRVTQDNITIQGSPDAVMDGTGLEGNTGIRVASLDPAKRINGFNLTGLTIQNYSRNGVLLLGADNFRISHGTYIDNDKYGIFPIFSSGGLIDHNRVSGSDDTGIYVGQSSDVIVKMNHTAGCTVGIEIELSSRIDVRANSCTENSIGIVVLVFPGRSVAATSDISVTDNIVSKNNRPNPVTDELVSQLPSGIGFLNIGGDCVTVQGNMAKKNQSAGLVVTQLPAEVAALDPRIDPFPDNNRILDNVVLRNGEHPDPKLSPLPGADLLWDLSGTGNCWTANVFKTSFPALLTCANRGSEIFLSFAELFDRCRYLKSWNRNDYH